MPRTLIAVPLMLALLAGLAPGNALAGPPDGVSGKMEFDRVAEGLRKYRKEKDTADRLLLLMRLAKTEDPRVAVALGEALVHEEGLVADMAASLLLRHYAHDDPPDGTDSKTRRKAALQWWAENFIALRYHARQLPR
jgi:hypothetical protein